MQRIQSWNNLKFIKPKNISPFCLILRMNRIFVFLHKGNAAMRQFNHILPPFRIYKSILTCGAFFYPGKRLPNFSAIALTAILSCFFLFSGTNAFSQNEEIDPMPVKVKGQILNLEDETPVPNAIVINLRTHTTISADLQGRFLMDALNIDSLSVTSLGYSKGVARIPLNYNEMNTLIVYLKPVRFSLPDVNVHGEQKKVNLDGVPIGKKNDLAPELRGDAFTKKPPVIAAVLAPASFLQYHLSKSEREKRETRKAILTEKQWETLSQYYNKELVVQLTGLNNTEADHFMMYINGKGLLAQMKSEYDVRNIIKEQFKLYTEEGH